MNKLLFLANTIVVLIFIINLSHLPPQLPLFYSRPWGEDQLADSWMIFIILLLMDGLFFFNIFIQKKFFPDNVFVKKIISYLNFFLIITFTFIFIKIIFLVS